MWCPEVCLRPWQLRFSLPSEAGIQVSCAGRGQVTHLRGTGRPGSRGTVSGVWGGHVSWEA